MNNQEMKHIWNKRKTTRKLTPIKAIKFYCKEFCCVGDTKSWNECDMKSCPLYAYRLGKRPDSKKLCVKSRGFEENKGNLNGGCK